MSSHDSNLRTLSALTFLAANPKKTGSVDAERRISGREGGWGGFRENFHAVCNFPFDTVQVMRATRKDCRICQIFTGSRRHAGWASAQRVHSLCAAEGRGQI